MIRLRVLWALAALLVIMTGPTSAAECLEKPDVLGTSRTLVVDPLEHVRIGTMQYPETLPLADHEVVLTECHRSAPLWRLIPKISQTRPN